MLKIVQTTENLSVFSSLTKIERTYKAGIRKAFYKIGKALEKHTNAKMQEPKTGRTYAVSRTSKAGKTRTITHVASAPGEVPWSKAPQTTGKLRKSLNFLVHGAEQLEYGAETPYAAYLEMGTKKMAPRPYLTEAFKATQKEAVNYFYEELGKALNKK